MIIQPVIDIAEICAKKGLSDVILSPGSRCAPLTLAFNRHPSIQVRTISDERAAAFIALGMAQASGKTVALVCTSGTAALNYAPAVAEAFYQNIPLLILTADRPPEWIDQLDGQTIRQQNIYGRHIKNSYSFPVDFSHPDAVWFANRMVSEAINETQALQKGPVHINIPLREPFYPSADESFNFSDVRTIEEISPEYAIPVSVKTNLEKEFLNYDRILVVAGQHYPNQEDLDALATFCKQTNAVVVGDIISNTHTFAKTIRHQDVFLSPKDQPVFQKLKPDLLITFGNSVISKNLKIFLRNHKPQVHWHIQEAGMVADTFQTLTKIVRCSPKHFFDTFSKNSLKTTAGSEFSLNWQQQEAAAKNYMKHFFSNASFNEFSALQYVWQNLPQNGKLHLANSMSVRYANLLTLPAHNQSTVYANRGTSGIDGSTSTAVGSAFTHTNLTTLITGDLAFFYDRNGLWHNYLPNNLRIILLNNQGGGIFRLIDGPKQQPELKEFFETRQLLQAQNTAQDFNLRYFHCKNQSELETVLPEFFDPKKPAAILEIATDSETNAAFFAHFKKSSPFNC